MFNLDIPTILQNGGWAGKAWAVRGDQHDYANLEWMDVSAKPTEQEMLDAELAAAKAWRIAKVKLEARERAYAACPLEKQLNIGRGRITGQAATDLNAAVNAVLDASNTAEADIAALTDVAAVLAFTW